MNLFEMIHHSSKFHFLFFIQVSFVSYGGSGISKSIAIDDISFLPDPCSADAPGKFSQLISIMRRSFKFSRF